MRVLRVLGPWQPNLPHLELLELAFIPPETRDVVLVPMGGDDECQALARLIRHVFDDLLHRADVALGVDAAIDQNMRARAVDRQRQQETVPEPYAVHSHADVLAGIGTRWCRCP